MISVIVPIYKVENFLPQCIDSIISQTYKDLEIILVDDGSPDNCPKICEEYAKKDSRIRVIHKENGGLSSARNAGLDAANGEYVSFVDSDDWIDVNTYSTLLPLLEKYDAEVVACDPFFLSEGNKDTYSNNNNKITELSGTENIFYHIVNRNPWLRFEVWNKLFKREIIGNNRFKVGQIYEDVFFDRMVLSNVNKVIHVAKPLYNYRISRKGNINSLFKDNRFSIFDELNEYISEFKRNNNQELKITYLFAALETCMLFYIAAIDLKATKNQKMRLKTVFKMYLLQIKECRCKIKIKYQIFRYLPNVYYLLSKSLH